MTYRPFGPLPDPAGWSAAVVAACDDKGRVLMQLRDDLPGLAGAGMWSLFGGGVEPGEDLIPAAIREFEEETGILLTSDELQPMALLPSVFRPDGVLYIHRCTRCILPEQVRLGEGAGFAFLTPAQIAAFNVLPQMQQMLSDLWP